MSIDESEARGRIASGLSEGNDERETGRARREAGRVAGSETARAGREPPARGSPALTKRQKRRQRRGSAEPGDADAASPRSHNVPHAAKRHPSSRRRRRRGAKGPSDEGAASQPQPPAVVDKEVASPKAVAANGAAAVTVGARSGPAHEDERARAPVYAALDLGTNNCRLLVAMPTRPGNFRVVDAFSRIVRLGEGLGRTGRLAAGAMDRALAALTICSQKLAAREVAGSRLIATEACRIAANGEEFIERVERETGLRLEIVSRETEARLAVSGCGSLVDREAKGAVLFDIGGGSTEIALLDLRHTNPRRLSNAIVAWTSLPVGVVTLAERYGGREVPPALFETMVEDVLYRIRAFGGRDRLDRIVGTSAFHLLGTSGTVTTLAGVHLDLERYDRRQVDGLWLTDAEVDGLVKRIAGWSFAERVANPCIGSDRADLVIAGCAILEAIRRIWPAPALRVADRGLREGLLTEMMAADGVWRRPGAVRPQPAVA